MLKYPKVRRLNIVKGSIFPNIDEMYLQLKFLHAFPYETDQLILNFKWKCEGPRAVQNFLKQNKQQMTGRQILPHFKARVISTVWC